MRYCVTFSGEYDMDELGNVFTCYKVCDTLDDARAEADDYERRTHYIATITAICD